MEDLALTLPLIPVANDHGQFVKIKFIGFQFLISLLMVENDHFTKHKPNAFEEPIMLNQK